MYGTWRCVDVMTDVRKEPVKQHLSGIFLTNTNFPDYIVLLQKREGEGVRSLVFLTKSDFLTCTLCLRRRGGAQGHIFSDKYNYYVLYRRGSGGEGVSNFPDKWKERRGAM